MAEIKKDKTGRILFTKEMKKEYTILFPMMAPIHFGLFRDVLEYYGYHAVLLTNHGPSVVQEGLKYVHNDTCYPALLVIGQMIDALKSGKYDESKTALLITQTGGGCRASNYIHLLRKALKKAGYAHIPVVSMNLSGMEKNPGFKLTIPLIRRLAAGLIFGDELMLLSNQTRPYEVNAGETDALIAKWSKELSPMLRSGKVLSQKVQAVMLDKIAASFAAIPTTPRKKVKVGVVGEIYIKYASLGNNDLEAFLANQDCEVMVPGMMGFMLFKVDNRMEDIRLYGGSSMKYRVVHILYKYLRGMETLLTTAVKKYPQFTPPGTYEHTKHLVKNVIGYGCKMGEGWLLTGEMLELCEMGYGNIVCAQPFGCLPNHIVGKGMVRKIRTIYPESNIVPIDYDPSATKVNQENRIKLMLSIAKEQME